MTKENLNPLDLSYHLSPTEDASDLYFNASNKLSHQINISETRPLLKINQHLYLCSTLPIKKGQYGLRYDNVIVKVTEFTGEDEKKALKTIEFTTDQKLFDIRIVDVITGKTENIGVPALPEKARIDHELINIVNLLEEFASRFNNRNVKGVDVEKLAEKEYPNWYTEYDEGRARGGYIKGYNQALQSNAGGFSLEDMGKFLEFVRDNYTGFGAPHLCYNKGRQEKTKQILERYIKSLAPSQQEESRFPETVEEVKEYERTGLLPKKDERKWSDGDIIKAVKLYETSDSSIEDIIRSLAPSKQEGEIGMWCELECSNLDVVSFGFAKSECKIKLINGQPIIHFKK